jgi:putative Ca2+/H+ antiporter (TMEM165/GDT1 family)
MPSFLFALVACLLATMGGRDQRMAASLSANLGASTGLLITLWITCAVSASFAAVVGAGIALYLPPAGKLMFVAFAMLIGAAELAWPWLWREPEEPTRSLFAIAFVIAARQLLDAGRFIVLAIAAATGAPVLAAIGGTIGGGVALTLGWAMGADLKERLPLRTMRLAIAALLFGAAVWTGLIARDIL